MYVWYILADFVGAPFGSGLLTRSADHPPIAIPRTEVRLQFHVRFLSLQATEPLRAAERVLGMEIRKWLPPDSAIVHVTPLMAQQLQALAGVVSVSPRLPWHKLSADLLPLPYRRTATPTTATSSDACSLFVGLSRSGRSRNEVLAQWMKHRVADCGGAAASWSARDSPVGSGWTGSAAEGVGWVEVGVVSAVKLKVRCSVCGFCRGWLAREIASHEHVEYVEVATDVASRNRISRWAMSAWDTTCSAAAASSAVAASDWLWARGLNGRGQVAAIADTGLDVQHCMFYDDLDLPFNTYNPLKRKVVSYYVPARCSPFNTSAGGGATTGGGTGAGAGAEGGGGFPAAVPCGDNGDETRGHGTFVTGSVVGDALSCTHNLSICTGTRDFAFAALYNPLAVGAKVAFTGAHFCKRQLATQLTIQNHYRVDF